MRTSIRSRLTFFLTIGMLGMLLGVPVLVWAGVSVPVHAAGSKGHHFGTRLVGTPSPYWCNPLMWHLVPSANVGGSQSDDLTSVSAVTTNRVWAVGYAQLSGATQVQTLIEEWTGTSWQIVSSPNVQNASNSLSGVATLTAGTAWAVGGTGLPNGVNQTLVEKWDGSRWAVVASPNVGTTLSSLSAVAAVSPDDVWAVGTFQTASGVYQTLTEHWNGTAWSVVASPNYADSNYPNDFLRGVVAVSSNDVWTVGYAQSPGLVATQPVVEHWNGTAWALVAVPIDSKFEFLESISAVATNDIWAVGLDNDGSTSLAMHWNGTQWSVVTSPNVGVTNVFAAVVAISATDAWAVGDTDFGQSLIEHWNGTAWGVVPDPNNPGFGNVTLSGVAAVNSGDVWTVGGFSNGGGDVTRTEQYQPIGLYPAIACPLH